MLTRAPPLQSLSLPIFPSFPFLDFSPLPPRTPPSGHLMYQSPTHSIDFPYQRPFIDSPPDLGPLETILTVFFFIAFSDLDKSFHCLQHYFTALSLFLRR